MNRIGLRTSALDQRPVALVILSGGGFTFETKCLLNQLKDDFDFVYLRTIFGGIPGEGDLPRGESHVVPSFATKTNKSLRSSFYAFMMTLKQTFIFVRRRPVAVMIGVGCSHVVPMFIVGRLFNVTTIFMESITRVQHLSTTGKLIYHSRLAKIYIVQWQALQSSYPLSRLGTIL